jgi:hypothetical protein
MRELECPPLPDPQYRLTKYSDFQLLTWYEVSALRHELLKISTATWPVGTATMEWLVEEVLKANLFRRNVFTVLSKRGFSECELRSIQIAIREDVRSDS